MTPLRIAPRFLLALMLGALLGGVSPATAQTSSFDLVVPEVSSGSQISHVDLTLRLTTTDPVRFQVQSPTGSTVTLPSSGYFSPGDMPESADVSGGSEDDIVWVVPPSATGVTVDEVQYKVIFQLLTDYGVPNCNSTMSGDETWTIILEPETGPDPQVASACPVSFRQRGGVTSCESVPPVLPSGPQARIISEAVSCQGSRPPVDAVLVLDKSGSMASAASPGSSDSRIEALRGSVEAFVTTWDSIRSVEASSSPSVDPPRDDELGMVFFAGDALRMNEVSVGAWSGRTDVLYDFTNLRPDISPTNLNSVAPGGVTSLGDGLIEAVNALGTGSSPDRRKVILAMSDGLQNTSEYVAVDAMTGDVQTHPRGDPTDTAPLVTSSDDIQIYTVTTGPSTNVGADLNEAIAGATGGFYTNAEIDASEMRIFFTEMLQNFVKFTSFETIHQAAPEFSEAGEMYTFSFPLTITSTSLVATLSAPRGDGWFGLRLRGPDGSEYEQEGQGTVTVAVPLLQQNPEDVAGAWTAEVEWIDPADEDAVAYLSIIADDVGTRTAFHTDAGDTEPGLAFLVTARPMGPSGPVADADVRVTVGRPEAGVGDILAQADVSPVPPNVRDPYTPAEAKLYRLLQENPDVLPRSSNVIRLRDNGQGGDQTGGDGIYSAEVAVGEPGHYMLQYVVEGETDETGPFRREQIHTVHARPVPNPGTTEVQAQIVDGALQLRIIPRTFTGGFLGPGFASYLWLTTPMGDPIHPQDQLDGTYTAQIGFTGQPPQVDLHFLRLFKALTDDIDQPPVELGEETQVVTNIQNGKERGEPVPPRGAPPDGPGGDSICSNLFGGLIGVLPFGIVLIGVVLVVRRRRSS